MQRFQQIKRGIALLRRLSSTSSTQILHASTSEEQPDNGEACSGSTYLLPVAVPQISSTNIIAEEFVSTSRSTKTKFMDVTQERWKKNDNVQSILSTINVTLVVHQQICSTSQQRTLSTQSVNRSSNLSSTKNTIDQQLADQQLSSKSANSSGTAAAGDNDSRSRMPQPPDPETCCESGCVNCVWIRYVQELIEYAPDDKEQIKNVLDLIEDYNVKMFVKMELDL